MIYYIIYFLLLYSLFQNANAIELKTLAFGKNDSKLELEQSSLFQNDNVVELEALAFGRDDSEQSYTSLVEDFNNYSQQNKLNIKINITLLSIKNSTFSMIDYGTIVDAFLKKNKFDLYFYDNVYIERYGKYLQELDDLIPESHISLFDPKVIEESCKYKKKLVGLPVVLGFSVLYSNPIYLNKYNKKVPETWDELLETSKYILKQEREQYNNYDLVGYNGLFDKTDVGTCSIHELLYSFRDSYESPVPRLRNKRSIEALKMMKKIKEEVASDDIFQSSDLDTCLKLFSGTGLFLKFFLFNKPVIDKIPYIVSPMPGREKGISGTSLTGYNLGINKGLKKVKLNAAIKAIQYITSIECQKKFLLNDALISPIVSLYEDKEVCEVLNCELYKNSQFTIRPNKINIMDYDVYSEKYRNYIYEYLFGNITVEVVLKNVEDILEIHYISLDTTDNNIGRIEFYIIIILIALMTQSTIFIFIENFQPYFRFMSIDSWIVTVMGSIMTMLVCLTKNGLWTNFKCHLQLLLLFLGFSFNYMPILYKLVVQFPLENSVSFWIKRFKYPFLFFFFCIDCMFCALYIIIPFAIDDVIVDKGENFQVCKMKNSKGVILMFSMLAYKLLIVICLLGLMFVEWNIKLLFYDIRFSISGIYMSILSVILLIVFDNIHMNNYKMYYKVRDCIIILLSLSNYFLIFGFRIILKFLEKQNVKLTFINNINQAFINSQCKESYKEKTTVLSSAYVTEIEQQATNSTISSDMNISNTNTNNTNSNTNNTNTNNNSINSNEINVSNNSHRPSIFSKILSCHYIVEKDKSSDRGTITYKD